MKQRTLAVLPSNLGLIPHHSYTPLSPELLRTTILLTYKLESPLLSLMTVQVAHIAHRLWHQTQEQTRTGTSLALPTVLLSRVLTGFQSVLQKENQEIFLKVCFEKQSFFFFFYPCQLQSREKRTDHRFFICHIVVPNTLFGDCFYLFISSVMEKLYIKNYCLSFPKY